MTLAKSIYKDYVPSGQDAGVLPIVENSRVLEIGFGSGSLLKQLRNKGNEVFGTDAGNRIVEKAKADGFRNVFLVDASEQDMPFEDDFFDAIYCFEVFEHLTNPHRLFSEIRRTLKPEHLLYFSVPSQEHTMGYGPSRHSFVYPGLLERENLERFFMQMYFKIDFYKENQVNIVHHRNYILKNMKQHGLPDIMEVILKNFSIPELYGKLLDAEQLNTEIERELKPYLQLMETLAGNENWGDFKYVAGEIMKLYPDHLPLYVSLAEIFFHHQKHDEARACLKSVRNISNLPSELSNRVTRLLSKFTE